MAYLPYTLAFDSGAECPFTEGCRTAGELMSFSLLWRSYRKVLNPGGGLLVTSAVVALLLLFDYLFQVGGMFL